MDPHPCQWLQGQALQLTGMTEGVSRPHIMQRKFSLFGVIHDRCYRESILAFFGWITATYCGYDRRGVGCQPLPMTAEASSGTAGMTAKRWIPATHCGMTNENKSVTCNVFLAARLPSSVHGELFVERLFFTPSAKVELPARLPLLLRLSSGFIVISPQ